MEGRIERIQVGRRDTPAEDEGALRCSFCRKTQDTVGKLISNPSDYPRAFICDECVRVCYSILEADVPGREKP